MLNRTLLAALAAALVLPAASHAAGKTETLASSPRCRAFTLTAPDGTVSHEPPPAPLAPGTVMEIDSLDYRGTPRSTRSARRSATTCAARSAPIPQNPDCFGYVAIDGSLLRFHGFDIIGGTGRYLGATGKTVASKEVEGGSEFVVKVKLR